MKIKYGTRRRLKLQNNTQESNTNHSNKSIKVTLFPIFTILTYCTNQCTIYEKQNDYSKEIEEGSHKHEPLDEEPDSLLELLELLLSLFLHAASFSILRGG